jgi:hypothetical protein
MACNLGQRGGDWDGEALANHLEKDRVAGLHKDANE